MLQQEGNMGKVTKKFKKLSLYSKYLHSIVLMVCNKQLIFMIVKRYIFGVIKVTKFRATLSKAVRELLILKDLNSVIAIITHK